jgi:hypothetical protein
MTYIIKLENRFHEFESILDASEFMDENPKSKMYVGPIPKGKRKKRHKSCGGTIEIPNGEAIDAFHRDGLQTDVWNCIIEGETRDQFIARVEAAGIDVKKAKNYFSQFKTKGWIQVT